MECRLFCESDSQNRVFTLFDLRSTASSRILIVEVYPYSRNGAPEIVRVEQSTVMMRINHFMKS